MYYPHYGNTKYQKIFKETIKKSQATKVAKKKKKKS